MSPDVDRGATTCCLFMLGLMAILFGAMAYFLPPHMDPVFDTLFIALIISGILMIVFGITLIPSSNRARRKVRSIYEIAAVRKEVTITEISSETGLDYEFVRKVITDSIIYGRLHGYLEDDLFVRDTGARQRYPSRQKGLFEASD
ncbi:MAG: hypothetical protein E4H14_20195 [Candidatus Thorarchaeota archaeon]|nr:MAG: hypothetical protein E4H14_20195 [Candidatus Thorarchaeota archaeon]